MADTGERTQTVADYPDAELLRRAVKNARGRAKRGQWVCSVDAPNLAQVVAGLHLAALGGQAQAVLARERRLLAQNLDLCFLLGHLRGKLSLLHLRG